MSWIQTGPLLLPASRRPLEQVPFFTPHPLRLSKIPAHTAGEPTKGSPMKTILTLIAAAVFLIYPCFVSASYVIHLKDGREFATDQYYEEGDQIKFKRYGGVIGIEKDLASEMELVEGVRR